MPFQPLQQILQTLEPQFQQPELLQLQAIQAIWLEIVGEKIAAQTCPIALSRNVLQVATSTPVWTHTLVFERPTILRKLNDRLGLALVELRFSTSQWQRSNPNRVNDDREIRQTHPSQLPAQNTHFEHQLALLNSPNTAFEQWASRIQQRSQHLPKCPNCGCPTPSGELERWAVCSLCAASLADFPQKIGE
jgi:predicted nucleic acid-binding Zn ribbon protein